MMTLFRDGFGRDLVVLMIVSIVAGTILSTGIAKAVDAYFGDTINGLIGDFGEYDLILHIREDAKEAAMTELKALAENRLPGMKMSDGVTIAGKVNVFIAIPEEEKTKETLENLDNIFGDIPGQSGFTLMIEPTVVVQGTHSAVRGRLIEEIEAVPGVSFVFRDGGSLYAVLESVDKSTEVNEAVKNILQQYQLLEISFPMGQETEDVASTGAVVIAELENRYAPSLIENITLSQDTENYQAFVKTLAEMKLFLENYATKVTIPIEGLEPLNVGNRVVVLTAEDNLAEGDPVGEEQLVIEVTSITGSEAKGLIIQGDISDVEGQGELNGYRVRAGKVGSRVGSVILENDRYRLIRAIDESIALLTQLDSLSGTADEAVENAQETLELFQESLVKLEELQTQIEELNRSLNGGPDAGAGNVVLSMLISQVMRGLVGDKSEESAGNLQDLDIAAMQETLAALAGQLKNVETVDVQLIIDQIQQVKESLPQLRDEEIGQSIQLINSYIQGQVIPGEKIQLLLDGDSVSAEEAQGVIREVLDNQYLSVYSSPVGIVNPNARAELFRVLSEVRATIAGMLAIFFTLLFLILDYSTVMSVMKQLESRITSRSLWKRVFSPVKFIGVALGAILLFTIYLASRAQIPYVAPWHMLILGGILGGLAAILCDRFSPVNEDEMMAGEALGLTYVQIMRNIVIPESRPGLLNLLNGWKKTF